MSVPRVKLLMVGDGAVGRTCLAVTHTTGTFPYTNGPLFFENTLTENIIDGKRVEYAIWDCTGGVGNSLTVPFFSSLT